MAEYEDTGHVNRDGPGYKLAPGLKAPPADNDRPPEPARGTFESGAAQAGDMDYQEAEDLDLPRGGRTDPRQP